MGHVVFEFIPKMGNETAHRHGGGIAEGTNGAPLDVIGQGMQQVQIILTSLTMLDAMDDTIQPARPFPAGRALSAGFFMIEQGQALQCPHHAGGFVHHDHRAGTEHGACFGNGIIVHVQLHHRVSG